MPSVHDVAKFILKERGSMTVMKLHKLLYYAQAWTLVWDEKPLFCQKIEAVCDVLGYEKKTRAKNMAYLGTLVSVRKS